MDFLNKALAQLAELFKQMTPGARVTAGLLLAIVVVSLGYLFTQQTTGGDSYLLGGQSFSAGEISAMEAAFGKANLGGYTIEGNRVRIPRGLQASYMGALADNGALPAHFGDFLTDATTKTGPFTSRVQQDELIKNAKQRELALIIRSMTNIEKAAVHYDAQKKGGLRAGMVTTASVSVKPRGTQALDEKQVPMIRHLVASAIAGLSPDSVTVVDLNGRTYSGSSGANGGGGSAFDDPYLSRVKEYQAWYERMVQNALSHVPGAMVTAHVELDRELHHRTEKDIFDPKNSATLVQREETNSSTTEGAAGGGGRPGLEAQQGANAPGRLGTAPSGPKSSDEKSVTEVQNAPSRERTSIEMAAMTPRRVTVSIGLPSSYFETIWLKRNPPAAGQPAKTPDAAALDLIQKEETDKIRAHVSNLLPVSTAAADTATPLVTVTTFSNVPSAEIADEPIARQALAWLSGSWSTLGLVLLGLVSLMMLRSMLQSSAEAASPASVAAAPLTPQPALYEPEEEEATPDKPKRTLKRRVGGPSLREELVEMVREDPDAAANVLRSWIGNAS